MVVLAAYFILGIGTGTFLLATGKLRSNDSDRVMDAISAIAVGLTWPIYWLMSFLVLISRSSGRIAAP